MQNAKHQLEIEKMAKIQEDQKENELAQQEMLEMLQLQMANEGADEEEDDEEQEVESTKSVSMLSEMERHAEEIRHLTDTISNLEDQVEEYSELLEQKNEERIKLGMLAMSYSDPLTVLLNAYFWQKSIALLFAFSAAIFIKASAGT